MRTVYKYEVPIDDETGFDAPAGAELLHIAAGPDPSTLYAWVLVNPQRLAEPVNLYIAGTGHPAPEIVMPSDFVQTVIAPPFVWHVWRRP